MGWADTFKKDPRQEYLTKILMFSSNGATAIRELVEDNKSDKHKQLLSQDDHLYLFLEFVYFYLHLTDRFAYGRMDDKQRDLLMIELEDTLINSVINSICQDWPEDIKAKIQQETMQAFYASMEEYSRYKKPFPENNNGTKDTLFWEFGKNIAKLVGHEYDSVIIIAAQTTVVDSLKNMNFESLLTG